MKQAGPWPIAAVIAAGGAGRRIGGLAKQFRAVGGRPLLAWSCARFATHRAVGPIVVVLPASIATHPPDWLEAWDVQVVAGGATRQESVRSGLARLAPETPAVLIHDAARPFISAEMVGRLASAVADGPVVPVIPLADTIKRMRSRRGEDATVVEVTVDREHLRAVQTPQAFPFPLIRDLHERAAGKDSPASDDSVLCEHAGIRVRTVEGERWAGKITRLEDLAVAEWLVASGRVRWPEGGRA